MVKRLLALCMCLCATAAAASAGERPKLAPADEYFGHLKMSVLGIANVLRDSRLRAADPMRSDSIFGSLAWVEDAIRDWESKYPEDTWIAKDLLALETTYLTAPGGHAHDCALRTEAWLRHDYANTTYAVLGHNALLRVGYTDDGSATSP